MAWIELARKAEADKDQKLRRDSLAEAGAILGDQMEAESQIAAQLELAAASIDLNPDRSFEVLGSAVDRLSLALNAIMTGAEFMQRRLTPDGVDARGIKNNEMALNDYRDITQALDQRLPVFARKDFDRAALALKGLQVDVVRMRTCLKLVDRVLRAEPRPGDNYLPMFFRR
jgi:hypothetical protein